MSDNNIVRRVKTLRAVLAKQKIDALIVTNFSNVTYLTGFLGEDSWASCNAAENISLNRQQIHRAGRKGMHRLQDNRTKRGDGKDSCADSGKAKSS